MKGIVVGKVCRLFYYRLFIYLIAIFKLSAQSGGSVAPAPIDAPPVIEEKSKLPAGLPSAFTPTPVIRPGSPSLTLGSGPEGVDWTGVFRASMRFLLIEHTFRVMTEPGTRAGLKGPFLHNYTAAVSNLHGWADGDEFYVNYVGHPMQGSVAGFLWVHNDRKYRAAEFGRNPLYWKSRLRATAFAWAYSVQFEIGPLSEASIGGVQAVYPAQGFVDHVITPIGGIGWMIAEDVLDEYLIKRLEGATRNRWARLFIRSGLNPSRTVSNVFNGAAPWHRDTRSGIRSFAPREQALVPAASRRPPPSVAASPEMGGVAPFELNTTFQSGLLGGNGNRTPCIGGAGTAALRVAPSWQIVFDVSGCKLAGLEPNLSGSSLTYMVGPRSTFGSRGPWSAHLQLLLGGNKLTERRIFPEKRKLLEEAAKNSKDPPSHADYMEDADANGFAVSMGGGVNYRINRALGIRVAELSYGRSWAGPVFGREFSSGMKLTSGLILYMGTW